MFGMDTSQIPLFAMLRGRMGYLAERQRVVAENVANADTPGFAPRDLKPFSFEATTPTMRVPDGVAQTAAEGLEMTHANHMGLPQSASSSRSKFKPVTGHDSETRLDGNSVVLEEEMIKMGDARMDYDAAIGFYQKSLSLLRLASRAPGK
jgi:flagellar basal-body rod protein FlgB